MKTGTSDKAYKKNKDKDNLFASNLMILVLKNGIQVPIMDFFSLVKKEKKNQPPWSLAPQSDF